MKLPGEHGHLTYCTNVHRGETWEEVWAALQGDVLAVRASAAPDKPFGIGLRLSGMALAEANQPSALDQMKSYLRENDAYVFTMNAFPYGPFHGVRVKEHVYLPDWRDEERLRYTDAAADYLAVILPERMSGSISTAPGALKTNVEDEATSAVMADRLVRHAAHLVDIERRTGRVIALAIEPEPSCFLETTDEAIAFFENHLFASAAIGRLAGLTGLSEGRSEEALRRHLGLCLDLCHAAVEFESPSEIYAALRAAGIGVPKLQISAGLRLPEVGPEAKEVLAPFDDGVYLHQVVERTSAGLARYLDLGDAFESLTTARSTEAREWRVHYHVPIFLENISPFHSTQFFVREALDLHRRQPISRHLEVETYTWGVLPPNHQPRNLPSAIARELQWVIQYLAA
jgi:sugar phosphate isomerase/epimerase